uniref:Uncharacterized protein n=1 Tax=Fagus sylvatica TaxID=28930 RepID=A0A2N9HXU3_FAGSY
MKKFWLDFIPRSGWGGTPRWVFEDLEVAGLGTWRCIVQDLEMAGSGSSKLMASNFCL